jgi:hypothetical protein
MAKNRQKSSKSFKVAKSAQNRPKCVVKAIFYPLISFSTTKLSQSGPKMCNPPFRLGFPKAAAFFHAFFECTRASTSHPHS